RDGRRRHPRPLAAGHARAARASPRTLAALRRRLPKLGGRDLPVARGRWGMTLRPRLWRPLIAASAAAAVGVTYAGVGAPLRPLVVLWFLAVCPGMALVRLLRLRDSVSELVLAV